MTSPTVLSVTGPIPEFLFNLGIVASIVIAHELGHYVVGWYVGVPRDRMRIRLVSARPHVALRDGDTFRSPTDERYGAILAQYVENDRGRYAYVAGGHALELLFVTTVVVTSLAGRVSDLGARFVWFSLLLAAIYLVVDAISTRRAGRPFGDGSVMWRMRPYTTIVFYFVFAAVLLSLALLTRLPQG